MVIAPGNKIKITKQGHTESTVCLVSEINGDRVEGVINFNGVVVTITIYLEPTMKIEWPVLVCDRCIRETVTTSKSEFYGHMICPSCKEREREWY